MFPQLSLITFVVGLVLGWGVTFGWNHYWDMVAELEASKQEVKQEQENVRIITKYSNLLNDVSAWYRANPVRVRVQDSKACPGGASLGAEDILLTVGGYKRSDGSAVNK